MERRARRYETSSRFSATTSEDISVKRTRPRGVDAFACPKVRAFREEFQWCKLTLHHRRRSGEDVQGTLDGGHILPLPLLLSLPELLPSPPLSTLSSSFSPPPREIRAHSENGSRVLSLSFSLVTFGLLTARVPRPWPDCGPSSRKELYRDRSQTLTVWTFLALPKAAQIK